MAADAATIGALRVSLGLDSAAYEKGLNDNMRRTQGFAKGVDQTLKGVHGSLDGLASRAGLAGTALASMGGIAAGVGVAIGGLVAALAGSRAAVAFADDIADSANRIAVSTDALQEYRFAIHALGGEYKDADTALEGFSRAFGAAHAGLSKRAAKPFEALGLDAKSFDSTEDALQAVIKKISALKSTAEQAALADKLGLTAMLPALRAGGDQIDALRRKAHDLGLVMDAELVARGGELNDQFEDLSQVVDVQLKSALIDLAPALTGLLSIIGDMAKGVAEVADLFRQIEHRTTNGLVERRADAVTQSARLGLKTIAGQKLSGSEKAVQDRLNQEIARIDAELATRATAAKPAPRTGTSATPVDGRGGADKAGAVRLASAAAIDAATKGELAARLALMGDIQKLADLKVQAIADETKAANARLQEEASQGKITQAAADRAAALNSLAAKEQQSLLRREAAAALEQHQIEMARQVDRYADSQAQAQANLASTAAERNALEAAILARRQAADRREQQAELDAQLARGEITEAYRAQVLAAQAGAQAAERAVAASNAKALLQEEANLQAEAALQLQIDVLSAEADAAQSSYERRNIQLKILELEQRLERLKLEEIAAAEKSTPAEKEIAKARLAVLDAVQQSAKRTLEDSVTLIDALKDAADAADDMAKALRSGDIAGAVGGLSKVLKNLSGLAGSTSALGSKLAGISKTLGTIGTAMGIGQSVTSAFGQKQTTGGAIGGGLGAVAGYILGGPIGAAIGATLGNAVGNLFKGGKESNYGALSTINGNSFSLSGDKRNSQTTQLATAASQAILNGEAALKAAGIKLTASVKTIDIGTRDATDIVLSDGRKLTSAVGDASAAAEASLKALLQGATYASEAQQKLVESMLAAGAGFDQIAASLDAYAAAQAKPQDIADAIQKLVDPKAFDQVQLKRDQDARRAAAQADRDAGNLTADQFAALNEQLAKLDSLELADLLKGYGDAVSSARDALLDEIEGDRAQLQQAVDARARDIEKSSEAYRDLAATLRGYAKSLALDETAASNARYSALEAEFTRIANLAGLGNLDAGAQLKDVSEQFRAVAKNNASSKVDYQRDVARIQAANIRAADVADRQATLADQQLSALYASVAALGVVNNSVLSVEEAVSRLQGALGSYSLKTGQQLGANPVSNAALVKATGYTGDFGTGGFQAWIVQQDEATKTAARKVLEQYGQSYRISGFKTGGAFTVGGFGGADSQLMQFMATPGEMVNISHGDSMGALKEAIEDLSTKTFAGLLAIAKNTGSTALLLQRWEGDGQPPTREEAA